jgi:hypothetical protein
MVKFNKREQVYGFHFIEMKRLLSDYSKTYDLGLEVVGITDSDLKLMKKSVKEFDKAAEKVKSWNETVATHPFGSVEFVETVLDHYAYFELLKKMERKEKIDFNGLKEKLDFFVFIADKEEMSKQEKARIEEKLAEITKLIKMAKKREMEQMLNS